MNLIYTSYEYHVGTGNIIESAASIATWQCRECQAEWLVDCMPGECPYCGTTFGVSVVLVEQSVGESSYARDLRGIVRELWAGKMDRDQAFGLFVNTIRLGLERAAYEGARSVGIAPNEFTPQERLEMLRAITDENSFVGQFIDLIINNSKAKGGKLGPLLQRVEMWALRYRDVANRLRLLAGGNIKLKWVLGPTKHCRTCGLMGNKIKRADYWRAYGPHPQGPVPNESIQCQGFRCQCELRPTDEPMSRGPLPGWP